MMSVDVILSAGFGVLTKNRTHLRGSPGSVAGLIGTLDTEYPGFKAAVCRDSGELKSFVRVFVGDREAGLQTELVAGDQIRFIQAMAGG